MRNTFGDKRDGSRRSTNDYDVNYENQYGNGYEGEAQGEYTEEYYDDGTGEYDPNAQGYEGGEYYDENYQGEYEGDYAQYDQNGEAGYEGYYEGSQEQYSEEYYDENYDGNYEGTYEETYEEQPSDDMFVASDATFDDLDDDFTYLNNLDDFSNEDAFGSRRISSRNLRNDKSRNSSGRGNSGRTSERTGRGNSGRTSERSGRTSERSDRRPVNSGRNGSTSERGGKRKKKRLTPGKIIGRAVLVLFTFLFITVAGLYMTMYLICKGPSPAAKDLFVSTILETGQMKFLASLYFTKDEIKEITSKNSMGTLDAELDTDLIKIPGGDSEDGEGAADFDINGFEMIELTGRTYYAKMLIINDPSRVKLTTIYDGSWPDYGKCLDELVEGGNYLAGVNGGEYQSDSNRGGHPKGLVVCDGEIQYCNPSAGDVMIGFNNDNILIIRDIGNMSAAAVKDLVSELDIRDAVTFKDIDDGDDNHFSKLIINGESIQLSGSGSGANPRTVIGQKADGTVLLLVTDGRGAAGHLGATAADIISIMQEYGAVNAANLDGGSSSSMYVDGEYEMTSVTLYYANSSWRLPLAFVIERRD